MANQAAGVAIRAMRLPLPSNTTTLKALEWQADVMLYAPSSSPHFRFDLFYFRFPTHFASMQAHYSPTEPGKGHAEAYGSVLPVYPGYHYGWSAQSNIYGIGYDGLKQVANEDVYPYMRYFFLNVDGLPGGVLAANIDSIAPLHSRIPITHKHTITYIEDVTNPSNDPPLLTLLPNTPVNPLPGHYAIWRMASNLQGRWITDADYYIPYTVFPSILMNNLPVLHNEYFWDPATGATLADHPIDLRYSKIRVYNSATNRWHELLSWKTTDSHAPAETTCGWSALTEGGKLSMRIDAGLGGQLLSTVGKWIFTGLTPNSYNPRIHATNNLVPLLPTTFQTLTIGSGTFTGPVWGGSGEPTIQQDVDRGLVILTPSTTKAACYKYTADYAGTYYLSCTYAPLYNLALGRTNHINVRAMANDEEVFSAEVDTNAFVDQTSYDTLINGAGSVTFNLTIQLLKGQTVYFLVDPVQTPGSGTGTTSIAIDPQVSYEIFPVLPDSTHLRCPRCGLVVREGNSLVPDGVTHSLVCQDCYDPPQEIRTWTQRHNRDPKSA